MSRFRPAMGDSVHSVLMGLSKLRAGRELETSLVDESKEAQAERLLKL